MSGKQKNNNLKVIAFKLPEDQVNSIKNLCEKGFYPSLSETVRIAITDFICHVIEITNQNESPYWLSMSDQDVLSGISASNKVSACTKMPYHLLKTIDNLIKENNQSFNNRTNFIRLAINNFLSKDSEIYDYWLSKNYKSNNVKSGMNIRNSSQLHAFH